MRLENQKYIEELERQKKLEEQKEKERREKEEKERREKEEKERKEKEEKERKEKEEKERKEKEEKERKEKEEKERKEKESKTKTYRNQEIVQGVTNWKDSVFKPEKKSLCPFDSEGWICPDNVTRTDLKGWDHYIYGQNPKKYLIQINIQFSTRVQHVMI